MGVPCRSPSRGGGYVGNNKTLEKIAIFKKGKISIKKIT